MIASNTSFRYSLPIIPRKKQFNSLSPPPQKKAAKVLVMSDKRKRKLCEDPETREKECPSLNVWQLKQLLSLYTPTEGEEKLPLDLLAKLIAKRTQGMENDYLLI